MCVVRNDFWYTVTVRRQRDKAKLGGEDAGADRALCAQAERSLPAQSQPV